MRYYFVIKKRSSVSSKKKIANKCPMPKVSDIIIALLARITIFLWISLLQSLCFFSNRVYSIKKKTSICSRTAVVWLTVLERRNKVDDRVLGTEKSLLGALWTLPSGSIHVCIFFFLTGCKANKKHQRKIAVSAGMQSMVTLTARWN